MTILFKNKRSSNRFHAQRHVTCRAIYIALFGLLRRRAIRADDISSIPTALDAFDGIIGMPVIPCWPPVFANLTHKICHESNSGAQSLQQPSRFEFLFFCSASIYYPFFTYFLNILFPLVLKSTP